MVESEQQHPVQRRRREERRPPQRRGGQVERKPGVRHKRGLDAVGPDRRILAPREGKLAGSRVPLHEIVLLHHKARPKRRVSLHRGGERHLERLPVEPLGRPKGERLVVGRRVGKEFLKQPHSSLGRKSREEERFAPHLGSQQRAYGRCQGVDRLR